MTLMTTTRKSDQGKAWSLNTPALKKLKMTFSSRSQNWRTILKDYENKCRVATKQHRLIHKDTFLQPQNTNSLRDTGDNTTHMVLVVVILPQLVCPSKPAALRKSKQLAGECHRSSGLLMLSCALMCMSAGQFVILCSAMGVSASVCRLYRRNHLLSFGKFPEQCDVCNEAC